MSSMLGYLTGEFRVAACLLLVGGIGACSGPKVLPIQSGVQEKTISDVQVEHYGADTVVILEGLEHPAFSAFVRPEQNQIVVDLDSAVPWKFEGSISVNDGLVNEVVLSPLATESDESMTRIEISLGTDAEADYEVEPSDTGLRIRVFGAEEYDPWADAAADASEESVAFDPEPMVLEGEEPQAATKILAIEVEEAGDGTLVRVNADGQVQSTSVFTLEDPSRLVVDLLGLISEVNDKTLELNSAHVARVRLGEHSDKVRLVVDAGSIEEPFNERRILPTPQGLVIALGGGEAMDRVVSALQRPATPVAVASSPALQESETFSEDSETFGEDSETFGEDSEIFADSDVDVDAEIASDEWPPTVVFESGEEALVDVVEESELVEPSPIAEFVEAPLDSPAAIYGVEFDSQRPRDRIVVLADRPSDYRLFEPDADTLIISIEDAVIDPEAAVRIKPDLGGPVSLVTAFDQPDLEKPEVRLVVRRAPNMKPEISRRGSLLIIDFPRDGSVAAAPPEIVPAPETGAVAEQTVVAASDESPKLDEITPAIEATQPLATSNEPEFMPAAMTPDSSIDILQVGGLIDGKQYVGRRVSFDFKNVDLSDVLRLIAEVSELNVIAGDDVKGTVTIRLVEVPWDQALDVVLMTKGLAFMRIGNVLRIAPKTVIQQEEEVRLQERRAKEKLEDLIVKLQPVNYADVSDVSKMVNKLLSPRGSVYTDKRTNTLIMKDIASVIDEATALIKAVDTQTPQVMIEAKIVEAKLQFSREFGGKWGIGEQPFNDAFSPSTPLRSDLGSPDLLFHGPGLGPLGFGNNAVFDNQITAKPTALINMAAFLLDEKLNLELEIQAAELEGNGKVISSPRLVTLDNSKALIEQGVALPFQTFENGDSALEFVDAVLKLEVTPHITANKSIIMKIMVSRNAPDDSVVTILGTPAIAKNQVKTETLVKDGQTLVLGGIYVIEKTDKQSRVPYLHNIPIFGAAFRSDEQSDIRRELLIFVTPTILQSVDDG